MSVWFEVNLWNLKVVTVIHHCRWCPGSLHACNQRGCGTPEWSSLAACYRHPTQAWPVHQEPASQQIHGRLNPLLSTKKLPKQNCEQLGVNLQDVISSSTNKTLTWTVSLLISLYHRWHLLLSSSSIWQYSVTSVSSWRLMWCVDSVMNPTCEGRGEKTCPSVLLRAVAASQRRRGGREWGREGK